MLQVENTNKATEMMQENLPLLVDVFYYKVWAHERLGPVFDQTIGNNWEDWQPHLRIMYNFWITVMLGEGDYRGNPLRVHLGLPPFEQNLFEAWLDLFQETALEHFEVGPASQLIRRSEVIAMTMQHHLYPSTPPTGLKEA